MPLRHHEDITDAFYALLKNKITSDGISKDIANDFLDAIDNENIITLEIYLDNINDYVGDYLVQASQFAPQLNYEIKKAVDRTAGDPVKGAYMLIKIAKKYLKFFSDRSYQ